MRIEVGIEHIKNGVRDAGTKCPVALAMQSAGYRMADVGPRVTCWSPRPGAVKSLLTPDAVCHWITRFDLGLEVEPFDFEVEEV